MSEDILREAVAEVISRLRNKRDSTAQMGPDDKERMADHLERAMNGECV